MPIIINLLTSFEPATVGINRHFPQTNSD